MHARGVSMSLYYRRANDPPDAWTAINQTDHWDFNNQVLLPISPELVLMNGDQLRSTCTWSTALGPVALGQSSSNEMCYFYLYHHRAAGEIPPLIPFYNYVGPPD